MEFSFDTDEVIIERHGDALVLRPRRERGWDRFFANPALRLPGGYEPPEDPPPQERDVP